MRYALIALLLAGCTSHHKDKSDDVDVHFCIGKCENYDLNYSMDCSCKPPPKKVKK